MLPRSVTTFRSFRSYYGVLLTSIIGASLFASRVIITQHCNCKISQSLCPYVLYRKLRLVTIALIHIRLPCADWVTIVSPTPSTRHFKGLVVACRSDERVHTYMRSGTHVHTQWHTRARTHLHTRARAHIHTRTHTYAHSLSPSLSRVSHSAVRPHFIWRSDTYIFQYNL